MSESALPSEEDDSKKMKREGPKTRLLNSDSTQVMSITHYETNRTKNHKIMDVPVNDDVKTDDTSTYF